jgi:hypothetical protein
MQKQTCLDSVPLAGPVTVACEVMARAFRGEVCTGMSMQSAVQITLEHDVKHRLAGARSITAGGPGLGIDEIAYQLSVCMPNKTERKPTSTVPKGSRILKKCAMDACSPKQLCRLVERDVSNDTAGFSQAGSSCDFARENSSNDCNKGAIRVTKNTDAKSG